MPLQKLTRWAFGSHSKVQDWNRLCLQHASVARTVSQRSMLCMRGAPVAAERPEIFQELTILSDIWVQTQSRCRPLALLPASALRQGLRQGCEAGVSSPMRPPD